jgi:2-keto-4-pentenoate hydratase/2-oxohepta-3-ene-1,7-dioic acid hydratase in catechol pathway
MRYLSFIAGNRASFGIASSGGVFDLGARIGDVIPDLKTLLKAEALGFSGVPKAAGADFGPGEFTYAPVVANPDKVICVGLNYEDHRKETGHAEAAYPSLFLRFADTLIGHETPILMPSISTSLDFEAELAVIIGKPAFRVPEDKAMEHVAGYACFNDVSVRDWQRHTHQFTPGKNFPTSGPFGPELVTPDEMGPIGSQRIETRLNGAVMQSATLGDMIFSIPRIIAYCSGFTRLRPGDVIATGTPGGVGARRQPPLFMKVGDTVEVSVGGVGTLRNVIAAEPADA